jgi:ribosomal protein S18 acetylase RimI-like enzyme
MTGTADAVPDAAGGDLSSQHKALRDIALRDIAPGTDGQLARELLDLQRTAYAVEAALIGDDRIPPLHETSADLRRAALQRRGAFLGPRLVGAAAWTDEPQLVDIDRLVVAPDVHRRGIASALVRHVLERAGRRPTVVATGRDNTPARTLYERLGFAPTAQREVVPGLWICQYRQEAPQCTEPVTGA